MSSWRPSGTDMRLRSSRAALVLTMLVATGVLVGGCAKESQLADEDTVRPGRIVRAEGDYGGRVLFDPWIRAIKVGRTGTFGTEITRQVRFGVDGFGVLAARKITLETPPTVALYDGAGGERFERVLRGSLEVLDEREGFIRGMSLTTDRAGYEAAALAGIIEESGVDGTITKADRSFITSLFRFYAQELSRHSYAWYDPRTTWITLGPDVSNVLRARVLHPKQLTKERGMFAAYVIQHEFEHAVSPTTVDDDAYYGLQWLEEGGADTLAAWPGRATATAKALGLPYPKAYERKVYVAKDAGYPEWARSIRTLMRAGGIDPSSAQDFDEASAILQGGSLETVPHRLAATIAEAHGLSAARRGQLVTGIRRVQGDEGAAKRLVANYL
ncbi:MAG: hypothetical protein JWM86_1205 [Thermoleophilia bacterium]|nr:hypothetical protein [Thermoleophilia bacterium]